MKLIKEVHSIVGNEVNTEIENLTQQIEFFKSNIEQLGFKYFEYNYESVGELYSLSAKQLIDINNVHCSVLNNLINNAFKFLKKDELIVKTKNKKENI